MNRLLKACMVTVVAFSFLTATVFSSGPAWAATPVCKTGTAPPTDPYPGTTAAATNFESGNLSPFVPFTALTGTVSVSSAFSHSPSCSAHLHATTDNGSIAKMSVGLAAGMKESYADGWFNITTEGVAGNDVPYFRFFSGGIRFVDVFRHNITNDLVLRVTGPQGFVYTTLVPTVALSTWHHLVMHVVPNGAASGVQIWWDDKSVFAQTVNISATQFDALQLGAEHDQQMGDIYADDVIVNSGSETPTPVPGPLPGGGGGGGSVPPAATTEIQAKAAANPGLGTALSPITCGLVGSGCRQDFQTGVIYWTSSSGAHISRGAIRTVWGAQGFENGRLGYPTSDETPSKNGGAAQAYQGGAIYWSTTTGAHISTGAIRAVWGAQGFENGGLGYPTSDEIPSVNGGVVQTYQGGVIYWSPTTGAHISSGAIRAAWGAQGFEKGGLGYPTSNEIPSINGGVVQTYQGGVIYWSPAGGAHISSGAIRGAWGAQGYERGGLGYPTSNEIPGVGGGVAQTYQGGVIYWSPATGAHISSGAIRLLWGSLGFERGRLGYPTTNEYLTGNGGVAQNYQYGRIVWSPTTGARVA